jgi:hypothetical protein
MPRVVSTRRRCERHVGAKLEYVEVAERTKALRLQPAIVVVDSAEGDVAQLALRARAVVAPFVGRTDRRQKEPHALPKRRIEAGT